MAVHRCFAEVKLGPCGLDHGLQVNRVQHTAAGAVCIDAVGVDGDKLALVQDEKHGYDSLSSGGNLVHITFLFSRSKTSTIAPKKLAWHSALCSAHLQSLQMPITRSEERVSYLGLYL